MKKLFTASLSLLALVILTVGCAQQKPSADSATALSAAIPLASSGDLQTAKLPDSWSGAAGNVKIGSDASFSITTCDQNGFIHAITASDPSTCGSYSNCGVFTVEVGESNMPNYCQPAGTYVCNYSISTSISSGNTMHLDCGHGVAELTSDGLTAVL